VTGSLLLSLTLAAWVLLELGLRVLETSQGRGRTGRDRFSRILIAVTLGVSVGLAVSAAPSWSLGIADPRRAAGLIVMWLGLAVRIWAIAALGDAFRTTVEVEPGQPVVATGPYARIRHPSYAGLWLILIGLGLALGDWRSLAICALLPLPALLWRISVEEAELTRVLGDPYRRYQRQTRRLIPGVW
jgi:protein-S-isoprenylcysteine O-methyltransferase Ste14